MCEKYNILKKIYLFVLAYALGAVAMNNNYFIELPENYEVFKTIDAKKPSVGIILNLLAFFITVVLAWTLTQEELRLFLSNMGSLDALVKLWIFLAIMIVYMILHELVHGIAYKVLTKEKLTFGLTLSVAYCGVPHIYVKRIASLIATLAPFVLFSFFFGIIGLLNLSSTISFFSYLMLSVHVGGCAGDLWVAFILIFSHRKRNILVNDSGPKQTFYVEK